MATKPIITIFCAFTRKWAVDRWLLQLAALEHDPALTNLAFIVDGEEPYIYNKLVKFSQRYKYRSFYIRHNQNWRPNETNLTIRRTRVAEVHNQSKDLIIKGDGEIIIGLEDDTIIEQNRVASFDRLIDPLLKDESIGMVEGVQMGRWGAKIVGAWTVDDPNDPRKIYTMLPPVKERLFASGYQEISGGGWYGYATRRQLWLDCEYYTSTAQPWGPDVNFGIWLEKQGYRNLVDWKTVFGHRDFNKILYHDDKKTKLTQVVYNKDSNGKWQRSDYEQD